MPIAVGRTKGFETEKRVRPARRAKGAKTAKLATCREVAFGVNPCENEETCRPECDAIRKQWWLSTTHNESTTVRAADLRWHQCKLPHYTLNMFGRGLDPSGT